MIEKIFVHGTRLFCLRMLIKHVFGLSNIDLYICLFLQVQVRSQNVDKEH